MRCVLGAKPRRVISWIICSRSFVMGETSLAMHEHGLVGARKGAPGGQDDGGRGSLRAERDALATEAVRAPSGTAATSPAASAASFKRAGQVQQLGGESPLHNLMEVKC